MKLLVANWKMNPLTASDAKKLARAIDYENVVICPPFLFLSDVKTVIRKAELGVQDVFWESRGAFTGEVSPAQSKKAGARYAIIGHSERRRWLGESDEMVAKKVKAVYEAGLVPILAVGENLEERAAGKTFEVVRRQLQIDLSLFISHKSLLRNLVIAYEPVWAIGTGKSDNPLDTVKVIRFIATLLRSSKFSAKGGSAFGGKILSANLRTKFLYGGSINSQNAADFLKYKEIQGFLVGGSSIKPTEIRKIIMLSKQL